MIHEAVEKGRPVYLFLMDHGTNLSFVIFCDTPSTWGFPPQMEKKWVVFFQSVAECFHKFIKTHVARLGARGKLIQTGIRTIRLATPKPIQLYMG